MPGDTARGGDKTDSTVTNFASVLPLTIAAGVAVTAARLLGGPLALPALSLMFIAAGFLAALCAWRWRAEVHGSSIWLTASALVLIGFAGAVLSDSAAALLQLERLQTDAAMAFGD